MKPIKIFTGRQKEHNVQLLTLLYDNGPLSAWELTAKIRKIRRQSLHATLNKRLRELEKKGYVRRDNKKWYLRLKGIIAILLIQKTHKMWNPVWKEIFESKAEIIEQNSTPLLERYGITKEDLHTMRKKIGLDLEDFDAWVVLSQKAKSLMEKGLMDFDVIKEETLFGLIIMETMTTEQLSNIWNPEKKPNQA